jgi:hypothetical protein
VPRRGERERGGFVSATGSDAMQRQEGLQRQKCGVGLDKERRASSERRLSWYQKGQKRRTERRKGSRPRGTTNDSPGFLHARLAPAGVADRSQKRDAARQDDCGDGRRGGRETRRSQEMDERFSNLGLSNAITIYSNGSDGTRSTVNLAASYPVSYSKGSNRAEKRHTSSNGRVSGRQLSQTSFTTRSATSADGQLGFPVTERIALRREQAWLSGSLAWRQLAAKGKAA